MCSCSRDKKPHTEACRDAHRRYNETAAGYVRDVLYEIDRKRARAEAAASKLGIEAPWQTS
jgi:hypothetical protein